MPPLEHVPLDTEQDPRDLDQSDPLSKLRYESEIRSEQIAIFECEQNGLKDEKYA